MLVALGIALGAGIIAGIGVQLARPWLLRYINRVDTPFESANVENSTVRGATKPHSDALSAAPNYGGGEVSIVAPQRANDEQKFGVKPKRFVHWLLPARNRAEDERSLRLFSTVQIITACFAGFARKLQYLAAENTRISIGKILSLFSDGANDVSCFLRFYLWCSRSQMRTLDCMRCSSKRAYFLLDAISIQNAFI